MDTGASDSKAGFPELTPSPTLSCSFGWRKCFQEEFQQGPQ